MAYSEHGKQYRMMDEIFRNAKAIIQDRLAVIDVAADQLACGRWARKRWLKMAIGCSCIEIVR